MKSFGPSGSYLRPFCGHLASLVLHILDHVENILEYLGVIKEYFLISLNNIRSTFCYFEVIFGKLGIIFELFGTIQE